MGMVSSVAVEARRSCLWRTAVGGSVPPVLFIGGSKKIHVEGRRIDTGGSGKQYISFLDSFDYYFCTQQNVDGGICRVGILHVFSKHEKQFE